MPRSAIKVTEKLAKELEKLTGALLTDDGQEMFNPIPNKMPGENKDINLISMKRKLLGKELSHQAAMQGYETIEEANDFDIDDDIDKIVHNSRHEVMEEDIPEYIQAEEAAPWEEPAPKAEPTMESLQEIMEKIQKQMEEIKGSKAEEPK